MRTAEFLTKLRAVKQTGTGWEARCPAHEDHKASLSVTEGREGRILLKCFAGCSVESIVGALNYKLADLFPTAAKEKRNGEAHIVATYDYTDENCNLLFQCVRKEPKDFCQRRPDPARPGEWIWNLKGVRRVLYRLPELKAAIAAVGIIYIAEGEKDVDALVKHGFATTCNPLGAKLNGSTWLPEHTEMLRGAASVVVIADKDETGRAHARVVATVLQGVVKSVKLIELPDCGGKAVKDAADFFAVGGTADQLLELVNATPEFVPAPEPKPTKLGSVVSENIVDAWPALKPLPDDLPAVQRFNFDCLPGTFRPWVEDISERMQCPPDYPTVGAMVALATIIGRKVGIRPKRQDDWLIVPNLWGMAVGRPGLMKTPALEQALAPLNRLVAAALAKYEAEASAHKVSAMLDGQRAKLAEKAILGLLKDGNEQAARDLATSNLKEADTAPVLRRYKVNDSTVEKLGELLNQNPNGLLHYRDELVGLLRSLDKEGREDSRAFYLEAWNGTGDFTCDRIGRGTVRIEAVTLSILGAIQPGPLSDYLRQAVRSGVGDDGLLQRFQLAVWPDTSKEWRNVDRWPDSAAKNVAFAVFQYLDTVSAAAVGADGADGIPFLRFSPGAQERFDLWRAELEKILRSDCDHPAFEAHLAKYRKLVPALALVLHLANRDTGPVTLAALEKALLWANYLESHARRIYSAVLRPDAAAARELVKHLERGELPERFTLRETYRKGWTGLASKEDAEAATEILCELGWIRPVQGTGPANGRPASPSFEVHPKICQLPAKRTAKTDINPPGEVLAVASVAPVPCVENSRGARSQEMQPLQDKKSAEAIKLVEEFA